MAQPTSIQHSVPPPRPRIPGSGMMGPMGGSLLPLLLLIPLVLFGGFFYWWFVQRVEVGAKEILVLVRKVGDDLPTSGKDGKPIGEPFSQQSILYPELLTRLGEKPESTRFKGIMLEPRAQGRHFYDPIFWQRIVLPATEVNQDEVGILVRKFGRALPPDKVVATEPDERGPVSDWLRPGTYYFNPYAYDVIKVKPIVISAGFVGVQTLYSGKHPEKSNEYVVATGERGVQPDVLPPGMYYVNPYEKRVDIIDTRSHTIELTNGDVIRFPSNDSFDILLDCTVEYAIRQDVAPYVMVAVGVHDDIKEKLILPNVRSLCRIEGSKLFARDFISGDSRIAFQNRVFEGLREQCYAQGIEIRATLIRRIVPPQEIAGPISDRQVAAQQVKQFENEIKLADADARLVEQTELQKQNQAIGQMNRDVVTVVTEAEQRKSVAITNAQQRLEVAKLMLEAAKQDALALLSRGTAEAEIIRKQFEAKAQPLHDAVTAFGDGDSYAQYFFFQKMSPAVKSVLDSTDGPFGEIFRALSAKSTAKPGVRAADAGKATE